MATCPLQGLEQQLQLQLEPPPQSSEPLRYINARGCTVPVSQDIACKIPFLDTLFSGRVPNQQDPDGHYILDIDPLVLPAIFRSVTTGSCQYLLTALPSAVSDPTAIFTTLDYLCVDLPLPAFDIVFKKIGRVDRDDKHERGCGPYTSIFTTIGRNNSPKAREAAREAAVQLLLGIFNGAYAPSDPTSKQRLFDRVLFIVSHPKTFYRRLRRWAHQIGLQHIQGLKARQVKLLEEWREKGDNYEGSDAESCTGSSSSSRGPSSRGDDRGDDWYTYRQNCSDTCSD